MGGPATQEEVGPFLHNLFTDTDIIQMPFQSVTAPILAKSRTPKIKKLYEEIGGSPITKLTTIQGEKTVELLEN